MCNNKKYWNKCAKIYDRAMTKDKKTYEEMYSLILNRLNSNMTVLEIATGTGLIARHIAKGIKKIEAIDFSQEMINCAKKNNTAQNVQFKLLDACYLPYADKMFDAIIISNALHIMPNPQKTLAEAKRVLKSNGILIAPTFTYEKSLKSKIISVFFWMVGYKSYNEWTPDEYLTFLSDNGFKVTYSKVIKDSLPLTYTEANSF